MTIEEFGWLCGVLEGEGWFGAYDLRIVREGGLFYPVMGIGMTDADVIQRAGALLGTRVAGPRRQSKYPNAKSSYVATLVGLSAIGWMLSIYHRMGMRRRGQIRAAVSRFARQRRSRIHKYNDARRYLYSAAS